MTKEEYFVAANKFINKETSGREVFQTLLNEGSNLCKITDREIAMHMEVALSTVERWKDGITYPAPRIQRLIISKLVAKTF